VGFDQGRDLARDLGYQYYIRNITLFLLSYTPARTPLLAWSMAARRRDTLGTTMHQRWEWTGPSPKSKAAVQFRAWGPRPLRLVTVVQLINSDIDVQPYRVSHHSWVLSPRQDYFTGSCKCCATGARVWTDLQGLALLQEDSQRRRIGSHTSECSRLAPTT